MLGHASLIHNVFEHTINNYYTQWCVQFVLTRPVNYCLSQVKTDY